MKDTCSQSYNVQSSGHGPAASITFPSQMTREEKNITAMQKLKLDVVSLSVHDNHPWHLCGFPALPTDPHSRLRL